MNSSDRILPTHQREKMIAPCSWDMICQAGNLLNRPLLSHLSLYIFLCITNFSPLVCAFVGVCSKHKNTTKSSSQSAIIYIWAYTHTHRARESSCMCFYRSRKSAGPYSKCDEELFFSFFQIKLWIKSCCLDGC